VCTETSEEIDKGVHDLTCEESRKCSSYGLECSNVWKVRRRVMCTVVSKDCFSVGTGPLLSTLLSLLNTYWQLVFAIISRRASPWAASSTLLYCILHNWRIRPLLRTHDAISDRPSDTTKSQSYPSHYANSVQKQAKRKSIKDVTDGMQKGQVHQLHGKAGQSNHQHTTKILRGQHDPIDRTGKDGNGHVAKERQTWHSHTPQPQPPTTYTLPVQEWIAAWRPPPAHRPDPTTPAIGGLAQLTQWLTKQNKEQRTLAR
jgi:hypothetical protein